MTSKIKLYLLRKISDIVNENRITPQSLKPLVISGDGRTQNKFLISLPYDLLENLIGVPNMQKVTQIEPDEVIKQVDILQNRANRRITFVINNNIFIKEVLENCMSPDTVTKPKKIVVEFSSPNIAKPFHMGHLRSTIIGNFVSNLSQFQNNNVIRLNYLGDWGTQFGFIRVGVNKLNHNLETIKSNPVQLLYESYVYANKLAEKDPTIAKQAREEFKKLESGSPEDLKYWSDFMKYTKDELATTYERLGVRFDEYNYESMYCGKAITDIIDRLNKKHIMKKDHDGKYVTKIDRRKVSLLKSDGSTLYLTRDIAAAIDRFTRFNFDKMYYIAENGQNDHFNNLRGILYLLDVPWTDRIRHIKFGRIHGMSTRKGKVVFLKDILDECRELMRQRQILSPTTKVPVKDSITSDILGVSCVIINDLKQRRQKDYEFSWEKVLEVQGDGGIKLQYTHCRLVSLIKNANMPPALQCVPEMFVEPEAMELIRHLSRYPEILNKAEEQFEACVIVTYLFHLCNYINKAIKTLKVKGSDPDLAAQRLLLFETSRRVLHSGMSILGLRPLSQM